MVFRKYTLGRYRETLTMIKIQTTIKKSERTVLGLRLSSDFCSLRCKIQCYPAGMQAVRNIANMLHMNESATRSQHVRNLFAMRLRCVCQCFPMRLQCLCNAFVRHLQRNSIFLNIATAKLASQTSHKDLTLSNNFYWKVRILEPNSALHQAKRE